MAAVAKYAPAAKAVGAAVAPPPAPAAPPPPPAPGTLPPGVKEVQRIAAPGGGYYVLGSDGGVFAIADAQGKTPAFYGSVPMTKPQGSRNYTGIELNPTGGYTVTSDKGERYNFDTGFARNNGLQVPDAGNTLTSDPAFLAFLRTSGLGVETMANQVRQQTAAINAARETARGDINYGAENQARTTKGGYESRGILRSSNTQQALDRVERDRLNRQTQADTNAASQIAGLNQGLANKIIDVQNQAAERGLSTAQTQDLTGQLDSLKKRYAPELAQSGLSV